MKNNWQTKKLGEVLEYEQPTPYIVSSKNYKEEYETPVLTAGKSFILGKTKEKNGIFPKDKLPVIIFDDFTTATKFVDFPFKVKSSAMKILHPIKNISDAKFIFHLIQNISFDHTGIHKRYWISEYSKIKILLPPLREQHRIVKSLDETFEKIKKAKENAETNLQNTKELFESYLNNIFANPGKDWKKQNVGEFLKLEYGKPLDRKNRCLSGKFPVYGANGEKDRTNEFYCNKSTVIIGRKGSAGELNLTENKFWPLDVTYFVTFDDKKYNLKFIYFLLLTLKLTRLAKGVKPGINRNDVYLISVFTSNLKEQKSIVAKLDKFSAEIKKLELIYKQKITDLEELKKSILKKAFNGEL